MSAAFKAGREKLPKIQGFDLDRIDVKVGDVVIAPAQALGRQTSGIGGLANEGAVRRHYELDVGEVALEPEPESLLPGDMKVQIDFIN